jgi:hypothetical protein
MTDDYSPFAGLVCELDCVEKLLVGIENEEVSTDEATQALEQNEELKQFYEEVARGFRFDGELIVRYFHAGVVAYLQCIASCSRDRAIPDIKPDTGRRVVRDQGIIGSNTFVERMQEVLHSNPGIHAFINKWAQGCPGGAEICRKQIYSSLLNLHCLLGYADGFQFRYSQHDADDYSRQQEKAFHRRMSGGDMF